MCREYSVAARLVSIDRIRTAIRRTLLLARRIDITIVGDIDALISVLGYSNIGLGLALYQIVLLEINLNDLAIKTETATTEKLLELLNNV